MNDRLALGTVQFGLVYGLANTNGQVSAEEAQEILNYAEVSGIDTLDTAISYGDSEQVLGNIGIPNWKVISKLSPIPNTCSDVAAWVKSEFGASLKRLRVDRLYGLLLHKPDQLFGPQGQELYAALCDLKEEKLVEKIGVSIYDPDELNNIYANFDIDIVQAPYNIVDRRMLDSGWLEKLSENNIEIHVRSVMLQGLLLMTAETRPIKFSRWQPLWDCWQNWLTTTGMSPLQASMNYVLSQSKISKVIVGVDSKHQLEEILQATGNEIHDVPEGMRSNDVNLINPSNWQNL